MPSEIIKLYNRDEVLGRWPDLVQRNVSTGQDASGTIHVTQKLDTKLKKNDVLSLSVGTVAVPSYPEDACLVCPLVHARKTQRQPLRQGESASSERPNA